MPIIALTTDKDTVDLETVSTVVEILNYELAVRMETDPIDADNLIAKVEQKIKRVLTAHGPMNKRNVRRAIHADRDGLWAFEQATKNLQRAEEIVLRANGAYEVSPDLSPSAISQLNPTVAGA